MQSEHAKRNTVGKPSAKTNINQNRYPIMYIILNIALTSKRCANSVELKWTK